MSEFTVILENTTNIYNYVVIKNENYFLEYSDAHKLFKLMNYANATNYNKNVLIKFLKMSFVDFKHKYLDYVHDDMVDYFSNRTYSINTKMSRFINRYYDHCLTLYNDLNFVDCSNERIMFVVNRYKHKYSKSSAKFSHNLIKYLLAYKLRFPKKTKLFIELELDEVYDNLSEYYDFVMRYNNLTIIEKFAAKLAKDKLVVAATTFIDTTYNAMEDLNVDEIMITKDHILSVIASLSASPLASQRSFADRASQSPAAIALARSLE